MNFNWEEFKASDNIAVHCKTEEEAKDFCKQMHKHGMKWMRGTSYLEKNNWEDEKEETCYEADGTYQSKNYYDKHDYYILEWSNYTNEEKENNMNLELNNLTEEQKNQIIELAKKFEKENEVDKLDHDNDFEVASQSRKVDTVRGYSTEFMNDFFDLGLTAHTKEEAEKIRRRLLVEKELRDWAKKCKEPVDLRNERQNKYAVTYHCSSKIVYPEGYCTRVYNDIEFSDINIAKKAIESIGQGRLIRDYFGIDK